MSRGDGARAKPALGREMQARRLDRRRLSNDDYTSSMVTAMTLEGCWVFTVATLYHQGIEVNRKQTIAIVWQRQPRLPLLNYLHLSSYGTMILPLQGSAWVSCSQKSIRCTSRNEELLLHPKPSLHNRNTPHMRSYCKHGSPCSLEILILPTPRNAD